ncbi:RDD family protein [Streptomyces sp. 549]|uniref:RDD family protein n=1 Tax=Streptomyces sp. 549 TaxID=3049076 RepID=UPI0024C2A5EA|nr:RDD family protein [Streptomyces sp. 549]MDK1473794.1 RDD family protein [Streptomyces sp. 549]
MSTDQPQPGAGGEPPEHDPFRKPPPPDTPGGDPSGSDPYASPPPGGDPYGSQPPPAGGGGYGQGPYGSAPPPPYGYGQNPYGGAHGATDPVAGMPPLASRGRRLLARIVDGIIVGVPLMLITAPFTGSWEFTTQDGAGVDFGGGYVQTLLYALVYFLYEGFMLTTRGQTLGKMLLKVRVAMVENGALPAGNPGWVRAAVYSLPALVPCLGTIFWLVNVLFCTWDKPYQQCVHDKVGKTVVVTA